MHIENQLDVIQNSYWTYTEKSNSKIAIIPSRFLIFHNSRGKYFLIARLLNLHCSIIIRIIATFNENKVEKSEM